MNFKKSIPWMRLAAQQLMTPKIGGIMELVHYMGAIQAQDFPMSKWAIGCRLSDFTQQDVDAALGRADIVRTHVLRPTWHIVAGTDLMWMLQLTSPNILRITKGYHKNVGITPKILLSGINLLEKALSNVNDMSREEIAITLSKAKIKTDENRLAHFLIDAELNGLICSGTIDGNTQRYRLIPDHIRNGNLPIRDEALQRLALHYFTSHGPATLQDFHWWSGLSMSDCRKGISLNDANLSLYKDSGADYYFDETACSFVETKKQHHLLPSYDEFFIAYKDRSASIAETDNRKLFSINGIFSPSLITNGRAAGSWKRKIKKQEVHIDLQLFTAVSGISMRSLKSQIIRYGNFLGRKVVLEMENEK